MMKKAAVDEKKREEQRAKRAENEARKRIENGFDLNASMSSVGSKRKRGRSSSMFNRSMDETMEESFEGDNMEDDVDGHEGIVQRVVKRVKRRSRTMGEDDEAEVNPRLRSRDPVYGSTMASGLDEGAMAVEVDETAFEPGSSMPRGKRAKSMRRLKMHGTVRSRPKEKPTMIAPSNQARSEMLAAMASMAAEGGPVARVAAIGMDGPVGFPIGGSLAIGDVHELPPIQAGGFSADAQQFAMHAAAAAQALGKVYGNSSADVQDTNMVADPLSGKLMMVPSKPKHGKKVKNKSRSVMRARVGGSGKVGTAGGVVTMRDEDEELE